MSKTKFFVKYINNIGKFINNLLEKNLNKLNFKNLSFLLKNNKLILTIVALFVVFISYLLLPTFYKQSNISKKLITEFKGKFDVNVKFSQNIEYNLFPRPHFKTTAASIVENQNEISKIGKLKIYISLENLFSLKKINLNDFVFENAYFNLNKSNYNFFLQLLNKNFEDGKLIIKNSNVFFRNLNEEVLFINKILQMKFYYDFKDSKNIFYVDNEIFNIPFSMETFFNKDKSKLFSQIYLNMMRIKIENELNLTGGKKIGKSEIILNNLKRNIDYQIEKNNFYFHVFDKVDQPSVTYKGRLNFKPFYASLVGNLDEINFNYLFGTNAIISELLKTEIFNNKNIDFNLNINAKDVYKNLNFENIKIKSKIEEGLIDVDNTKFKWKDFANFELSESLIFVRDGELVLDGKLDITIKNYNKIYKFLVTPKKYRKNIEKINLNFTYNFDQKIAVLKDIKINSKIQEDLNNMLNNILLKKDNMQNRIYFKNLLNNALKVYSG